MRALAWVGARLSTALNEAIGQSVKWLVLVATLVSAANASLRYGFDLSSNAWLELQWYLFALIFLLGAGYTLKHNGHVRIDVLYGRLSPRAQAWIDLLGGVLFLLPVAGLMAWFSWGVFAESWAIQEVSAGLRRPVALAGQAGVAARLRVCCSCKAWPRSSSASACWPGSCRSPAEQAEEVV